MTLHLPFTSRTLPTRRQLGFAHAAFFVATGLWPVLSIRTFELVTGPKADKWLVKTVGTLIAIAGVVSLASARRRTLSPEIIALLNGVSGALGYISFHYARRGRISRIYYLDTVTESMLLAAWAATLLEETTETGTDQFDARSEEAQIAV